MREVHLEPLEASRDGPFCSGRIGPVQLMNLVNGEFMHSIGKAPAIWNGRGTAHLPAIGMVWGDLQLAFPRLLLASLATRMAQLNGRDRPHVLDHPDHTGHAFDLLVLPQPGTRSAGAAVGCDGDLFGEDQAKAAGRTRAQQHQVKIVHLPIGLRPIHRHRRHRDAIA